MVHITDGALTDKHFYFSYTLGIRWLYKERKIYNSLDSDLLIQDARYGGTLTIPVQAGTFGNRENVYDNSQRGFLDPITWIEAMVAGSNTSEFQLHEPTIVINTTNHFVTTPAFVPFIEKNHLKLLVSRVGAPAPVKIGQYISLGDNPSRIYKIMNYEASGLIWHLTPPRLPWSTGDPKPAELLRFRLLNPNDIEQYRDYNSRGPFRMEYMEAR